MPFRTHFTRLLLISLTCVLTPSVAFADLLDINVNNSTVYGQLLMHSFEKPELSFFGDIFHDEDENKIIGLGFYLSEPVEDERHYRPWIKIGMKAIGFETEFENDGGAIVPGGVVSFYIPGVTGLYFDAYGFYAPRVLSFGDAEDYVEISGRLVYQIMTAADVYFGYRHIEISLDKVKDIVMDDAFHAGITFRF